MAQETRLDLLRLLFARGASGLAAGEIAGRLGVPSSTLSFHLAAMEREGLLTATRQGRSIVYAVRVMGMRDLLGFLTETCCAGQPGLCGDIAGLLPAVSEAPSMTPSFNVLFLCTANSARSIMAEAILNTVGAGRFHAWSAGSAPADRPQPKVIERLASLGHDVASLRSKSWEEFMGKEAPPMDFVIALCDMLEGQQCPDFGDRAVTGAWPLPDPMKFTGSAVEQAALLNELYAALDRRIRIFVNLPFAALDRIAARKRLDEIGAWVRA
ncbi:MAG: helix-turn-helix domain-containing protein [Alphaproteobacteria bacterium]|nr:helix-turn-helix domain-containing protein [Alphaproteobacteria bacterium]